jgi:hypothetical protein
MAAVVSHKTHVRKSGMAPEVLLVGILVFVVVVFSLFGRFSGPDPQVQPVSAADVSSSLSAVPSSEVSAALSALLGPNVTIVSIEFLSESNLSSLAVSQPVIYGGVPAPVYRATVNEGGKSFLMLYDFSSGMVLRRFEVIGVQLN